MAGSVKNGTCHHGSRTGAYALNDDVFGQGILAFGSCRNANGNDGNGDGSLENLAHLQSEVGSGGTKEHRHEHAPRDRPAIYFRIVHFRIQHWLIFFALAQLSERVFGQLRAVVFLLF